MQTVDRHELLARVDLVELATQVCGPPRGRGSSTRWHCANPDHSDQRPSMGVFRDRAGHQRWKCHACGEGGTAIDMVMISGGVGAGEALRELARSAGLDHPGRADPAPPGRHRDLDHTLPGLPSPDRQLPPATSPDPAVERFVAAAQEMLWAPLASHARRYLHRRGFTKELILANRVGYDPGPYVLPRAQGLPSRGDGIVFPALDPAHGQAVYFQVRALNPKAAEDRKYDQPTAAMAPNPRLARVLDPNPTTSAATGSTLAICEGFPDAYTATMAGLPAVALLGVSHAAAAGVDGLAASLMQTHPASSYAICFDNDSRADQFALVLGDRLARAGATVTRLSPAVPHKDLNEWWLAARAELTSQLQVPPLGPAAPPGHLGALLTG